MPEGPSPSLTDLGSLRRGNFHYFPVAPGRMEFATLVRRAILHRQPAVVAVELPVSLAETYRSAVARLPKLSAIFYADEEREDAAVYLPIEVSDPFVEAVRTAAEIGAEVLFLDADRGDHPLGPLRYPDSYALTRIPLSRYVEQHRLHPRGRTDAVERQAQGMAWKLQGADPLAATLVVISLHLLDPLLDAMERPQAQPIERRRTGVRLVHPHPACLAEITVEYPKLQEKYEEARRHPDMMLDRRRVQLAVFRQAEKLYEKNAGETVKRWQRGLLARYTRNLALQSGDLTASLFDLTVSARSVVDDNYAWEVWETAGAYRFQAEQAELPVAHISGEEVWLDTKRIRLRRRLPSEKRRAKPLGLRKRPKEKHPGEWASELNGESICSYPPEDLVVEGFGQFLKKKGKSVLSEERSRTEPFSASMLDGIDLRETIRNWHQGRIYVREARKIRGEVGAVVVIFDEDPQGKYRYLTTWLGEHQNESDMAFYSTFPFEHMVGPGIGRSEYGGFLMSLPARRMADVWHDPDYDFAENKPERLLLAALDYSLERHIVYVAAKPPRSVFRNIAARLGRTIIYLPIGQLSPITLKKIRVVHVLDGYDKRALAKQYLW